jgi:hypothetical protein
MHKMSSQRRFCRSNAKTGGIIHHVWQVRISQSAVITKLKIRRESLNKVLWLPDINGKLVKAEQLLFKDVQLHDKAPSSIVFNVCLQLLTDDKLGRDFNIASTGV